jgi:hypothetical protein
MRKLSLKQQLYQRIIELKIILVIYYKLLFKHNLFCRLFGHYASNKPIHGIIRCKRCGYPIYRVK